MRCQQAEVGYGKNSKLTKSGCRKNTRVGCLERRRETNKTEQAVEKRKKGGQQRPKLEEEGHQGVLAEGKLMSRLLWY